MTPIEREKLARWAESLRDMLKHLGVRVPSDIDALDQIAAALREPVGEPERPKCPKCSAEWVHWSEAIQCFALCAGLTVTVSQAGTAGSVPQSGCTTPGQPQPATPTSEPSSDRTAETCARCGIATRGLCGECLSLCWPRGVPQPATFTDGNGAIHLEARDAHTDDASRCCPGVQPATKLDALLMEARERVAQMSPQEREAMIAKQRDSWVRGEMALSETERKTTVLHQPATPEATPEVTPEASTPPPTDPSYRYPQTLIVLKDALAAATKESDALRAEVETLREKLKDAWRSCTEHADDCTRLRAEVDRMRPVVAAASRWWTGHEAKTVELHRALSEYHTSAKEQP